MQHKIDKKLNKKNNYFLIIPLLIFFVFLFLILSVSIVYADECKWSKYRYYDDVLDNFDAIPAWGHYDEGWNGPGTCTATVSWTVSAAWPPPPLLELVSCTYQIVQKTGVDTWDFDPSDPSAWLYPSDEVDENWCATQVVATKALDLVIDITDPAVADCFTPGGEGCMLVLRAVNNNSQELIGAGTFDIGQPPEPPSNLVASVTECGETLKGNYLVKFSWDYVHLDAIDMDIYQIRMNKDNSFSIDVNGDPIYTAPEYACIGAVDELCEVDASPDIPSGGNVDYEPTASRWRDWLDGTGLDFGPQAEKWSETIYWEVRTSDVNGLWSLWSSSVACPSASCIQTPVHAFPWIDFDFPLDGVSVGEEAIFEDSSRCFDAPILGNPPVEGDCDPPGDSHFWNFPGDNLSDYNCTDTQPVWCEIGTPDPRIIYSAMLPPGIVRLEVTDDVGMCPKEESLSLKFPLPKYREVAPIL